MTEDERKAIKERADAAQKGPWFVGYEDGSGATCGKEGASITAPPERYEKVGRLPIIMGADFDGCPCGVLVQRDADFIAHARSDIPALLADIERLRGLIKDAEFAANESGMGGIMEESICPWCSITEPLKRLLACSDVMHRNMAAYNRDPKRIAEPMPQIFSPHASDCPAFTPEGVVK